MNIVLDGHSFVLKSDTGVLRTPLVEWPTNTRLDGQQKRKDRSLLSSYVIDDWSGGLGIERQNVENANHASRLWDAENVDTRFPSQITLSPAFVTCTINPSIGDLNIAIQHLNDIYFLRTTQTTTIEQAATAKAGGVAYKFTVPDILASLSHIANVNNNTTDGTVVVGSISNAYVTGQNIGFIWCRVGSGATPDNGFFNEIWSVPSIGQNLSLNDASRIINTNIVYSRFSQMADLTGTIHIVAHRNNNTVEFLIANTSFDDPSSKSTIKTNVGSYLSPLVSDGVSMYAALPDGIYDFDITPGKIVDNSRQLDSNVNQVMFKNELYFKNGYSLIHYDGTNLTGVGYDLDDGLPSDKMGQITAITSNYKWIYAAVKGATYSHILTRDQGGAWQYYARIPTAGLWVREMMLSNSPDGIDRLWCLFDNYAYPGYFSNPVVNPLIAGTYYFDNAVGYFTKPVFDGGLGEVDGAFYDGLATIEETFSSQQVTISNKILYGLEGATPTTVLSVKNTITGTVYVSGIFGSPYGIKCKQMQIRVQLDKDPLPDSPTNGYSSIFRNAIFHYLKDPDKRESFEFTIDVNNTARSFAIPQEAILATLSAIADTKTLLPFHYGLVATRQVKVLDIPAQEEIYDDNIMGGERNAYVKLRVAEIL